jgi:hypothetical protein
MGEGRMRTQRSASRLGYGRASGRRAVMYTFLLVGHVARKHVDNANKGSYKARSCEVSVKTFRKGNTYAYRTAQSMSGSHHSCSPYRLRHDGNRMGYCRQH